MHVLFACFSHDMMQHKWYNMISNIIRDRLRYMNNQHKNILVDYARSLRAWGHKETRQTGRRCSSSCSYMCPTTAAYVSSYCYMCPHTAICVLILLCPRTIVNGTTMCPHTPHTSQIISATKKSKSFVGRSVLLGCAGCLFRFSFLFGRALTFVCA